VSGGGGERPRWYLDPVSELAPDYFTKHLAEVDPEIAKVVEDEERRQETTLEMIASENFVPQAILDAQGSVLTNKYAEGYPGRRYYGGCEYVDVAEQLAIDRAKELFGAEAVNVQPHAGAQANAAVYHALLQPGDSILGMKLDHGGHLSHGMKINFSGRLYDIVAYGVREEDSRIDMDALGKLAEEFRPKLILAGWSAYPRQLDFARFREVADSVGALLMVDMAHFAGLVAAGEHPSPVPYADVVTTTIHKTLGGARGGMIMSREEHAKKINSAVFPGQQGGPLMHVVAGKAVALKIAQSELFRERQRRTRAGAAALAEELMSGGVNVLTGGTDVHLVLADLRESELDGQQAEDRLHEIGITVNRNAVPFDPRPPAVSSGLRVGASALATRGFEVEDFREIGRVIVQALTGGFSESDRAELADRTRALAERHPLYPQFTPAAV
jgi:glycine hydroxymethyltransferase